MTATAETTPTATASATPTLEARGIRKSFGSVDALTDVDFEVRSGEVMALVGDNGAGKSTLIKCIAGIYPIDEGETWFDGQRVSISGPKDAVEARDRDRLPGSRALRQPRRRPEHVPRPRGARLHRPAPRGADGARGPPRRCKGLRVTTIRSIRQPVASLSGGQRQSVAIGRAVDVELARRDPRRADRRARGRADRSRCSSSCSASRSRDSPSS